MRVTLLHNSPLWLASHAIRFSHDNHDKSDSYSEIRTYDIDEDITTYESKVIVIGEKDKALIARVGNKMKHKSVLEQLVYWFDIADISRACLQELARHRTARLTVKSSRYTLKQIKEYTGAVWGEFLVDVGNDRLNENNAEALYYIHEAMNSQSISNDIAKYSLPEAFKTKLQWQIDGRNLQSFLELRSSKDALWEIRLLARAIFEALPTEHSYLFKEYMKDNV